MRALGCIYIDFFLESKKIPLTRRFGSIFFENTTDRDYRGCQWRDAVRDDGKPFVLVAIVRFRFGSNGRGERAIVGDRD